MASLLAVCFALCCMLWGVNALEAPPYFELNLDLPPEQRWTGAVEAVIAAHGWDHSFGPVLGLYLPIGWVVPKGDEEKLSNVLQQRFPSNYEEMKGLWNALVKHGHVNELVSFTQFTVSAFAYEVEHLNFLSHGRYKKTAFTRACTAILSLPRDPSLPIIHGRNMDEEPHPGRNMTLRINATRGGKTVWEAVDWLWFTSGVGTTQRKGGVTLELNYRAFFNGDKAWNFTYSEMVQRLEENTTVPVLFLHRQVMEKQLDFDQTVTFATQQATFACPFYCIMSGTQRRGAILTLHFHRSFDVVQYFNDLSVDPVSGDNTWYIVQTNYDHWKPDPKNDPRRTVAENIMNILGRKRGSTSLGVWMALGVFPVHNQNTMYTALLSVEDDIEGYIRTGMVPEQSFMAKP